jgi:hypothetical protein
LRDDGTIRIDDTLIPDTDPKTCIYRVSNKRVPDVSSNDTESGVLYDGIVIGLGGVGSFALRSLARGKEGREDGRRNNNSNNNNLGTNNNENCNCDNKNNNNNTSGGSGTSGSGLEVLGLERSRIDGHELGSSHGHTRLFRHAYFEHPSYVPMCLKSTETFRQLSDVVEAGLGPRTRNQNRNRR